MEHSHITCQHEWRYLVDVRARAIRIRECARCGRRGIVPVELAPLPPGAPGAERWRETA